MSAPRTISIDPGKPDRTLIEEAVMTLKAGGIVAYPTETFYGLGADGMNEEAVEKIFLIKGRAHTNPIPVIIGEEENLWPLTITVDETSRRLIRAFWPGPLTLVFFAAPHISPRLTGNTGKIGVRISSHPIAACLARALGRPLTATSANPSGRGECTTAAEVHRILGNLVDLIIDGGMSPGGLGSTILDMTSQPPAVIREGRIPASRLWNVIGGAPGQREI
jgi:L-threonylcarbamoyladenylate synthase